MGFLLDVVLAAVMVVSLLLGIKSGVVRTLVGFAGGIFAMAASAVLSDFAADVFCGMVGESHAATPIEYNMIRINRYTYRCGAAIFGVPRGPCAGSDVPAARAEFD